MPFFTRNPERAKFKLGFTPVVGAIGRICESYAVKNTLDENSSPVELDGITAELQTTTVQPAVVARLFSKTAINQLQVPKLIRYAPLSKGKEQVGEIAIAQFLTQLFQLTENETWLNFLDSFVPKNPYEVLIFDHLRALTPENSAPQRFYFVDHAELQSYFNHDLKNITANPGFFMSHIEYFFAFYYFAYVIKAIATIGRSAKDATHFHAYYALADEHLSQSRRAASSFRSLHKSARYLLVDNDVLDYLNVLLGHEEDYLFLQDIYALSPNEQVELDRLLLVFMRDYQTRKNHPVTYEEAGDLAQHIEQLRKILIQDEADEPMSRFTKSFEEIGDLFFTKSRGRIGKTFSLDDELLLVLVAVIVGDHKMLLKQVIQELNNRNIYLDIASQNLLAAKLDEKNLLEKMSDSGDAQYVKPIL
ncbi:hypothetical protein FC83_GL001830 [Agrilactobacillus composti DSM 18527 = JCM 14202]|uniref:DNA phosphorothioation-dependent restriction protein DptG n=1 Tax=Agrilactobacillus composti DSM 18527 = JCM 14202 TaxID=1423734 RepID=X0QHW8_9LACO|nr:DNA phosphorothioation-dependent restriction protein DptG [Agrilactobacillus composti]KRM30694.1 hypothetical protein FC83_GL001830 [Agrilactobacillus composti DSM 18527 = JCM 14202]GAF38205.1 hypothetical protein JCM14202_1 [Agrilactobacillus composti DSM 18527 = JCM 14202]